MSWGEKRDSELEEAKAVSKGERLKAHEEEER
jgi:hypothetical protein